MIERLGPSLGLLIAALAVGPTAPAQTETTLLQISHSAIGSNGFGTSWRGQDVELTEDAWLTRIVFQTGSATPNVDEIRLMTDANNLTTLRTVTSFQTTSTEVEAVLTDPYLLRGSVRYTVWFHQSGSPRGTYGCDLLRVDPSWGAYHTNVDPTQAPGPGEPSYYWGYQYGTNMRLIGYDNLEITGNLAVGGNAQIQLEAQPNDIAFLLLALGTTDQPFWIFTGPLRLMPSLIVPAHYAGNTGPTGLWTNNLNIPNDPSLHGATLYTQGLYDANFRLGGTFSPMEPLPIQ